MKLWFIKTVAYKTVPHKSVADKSVAYKSVANYVGNKYKVVPLLRCECICNTLPSVNLFKLLTF